METQRILMRSLAVVVFASVIWTITGFETEQGEFCLDGRQPWVKEEVKLLRAQNKSLTSTPPPASSISKLTPVGGSSQSTNRS